MNLVELENEREIVPEFVQRYYIEETFEILLNSISRQASLKKHSHLHAQFGYCFNGEFQFNLPNDSFIFKTNDSYVLKSNIEHSAIIIDDIYSLDFKFLNAEECLNNIKNNVWRQDDHVFNYVNKNYNIYLLKKTDSIISLSNTNDYFIVCKSNSELTICEQSFSIKPMRIYKIEEPNNSLTIQNNTETQVIVIQINK
jgi:hypothetical protein